MKTLTADQLADIRAEEFVAAAVLRVWLNNGDTLAFTGLDEDIVIDGVTYVAASGANLGDVASAATLEVDNLELNGLLVSPSITEDDLEAGVWDNAKVMIGKINALTPAHGILEQKRGWLGEVALENGRWKAEFRSLKAAYKIGIIELTSATCRAVFGDARCGVDAEALAVTGSVDSIDSDSVTIHDSARTEAPHPSGTAYFIGGKLTWVTCADARLEGLSMEIREATTGVLQLGTAMPFPVSNGDTYTLTPGCPKHKDDCKGSFDNYGRFRGEPDLPGNDLLFQQGRDE